MSSKIKKAIEEGKDTGTVDLVDRGISNLADLFHAGLSRSAGGTINRITRLSLSHNKISVVPPGICELVHLETLNLADNIIDELPPAICHLPNLKILNLSFNRLSSLPADFGAHYQHLDVLDLTYNNLNDNSLPPPFYYLDLLRALYLGDNEFETISPSIKELKSLQILVLRDNDLISLPPEIGLLGRLRELHIQNNRLTILPPELGNLDLTGVKYVFKAENNPWVHPIAEQFAIGITHVFDFIRCETYIHLYQRNIEAGRFGSAPKSDKSKKASKKSISK